MQKSDEVELKGGMYTFMSLRLHTADLDIIGERLAQKVHQAPGFFRDTPVVVDVSALESDDGLAVDTAALLALIREHRLLPIVASVANKTSQLAQAIALPLVEGGARRQNNSARGGTPSHERTSQDQADVGQSAAGSSSGPSLISGPGRGERQAAEGNANEDAVDDAPTAKRAADEAGNGAEYREKNRDDDDLLPPAEVEFVIKAPMLVTRPVRSGQQLYARGTDLIIMGPVGPGAEVIADNNIHVYGPLRGRALCGVSGNTETRIFCQSLEAELVSVAGNFRLLENIPEELRGKPAQIWLDRDRLNIEPL